MKQTECKPQIIQRVLSFDGGGIRGIYQAKLLEELSKHYPGLIARTDVLAGTSTGAIVAAALAVNMGPREIYFLYEELGKRVFNSFRRFRSRSNSYLLTNFPRYSSATLKKALEETKMNKVNFGDCQKRLIIAAVSLNRYQLILFDSHNPAFKETSLIDIVLASAAAPTYFAPVKIDASFYVDGGLCCNNPAFQAARILCADKKIDGKKIYAMSVGTGKNPDTIDRKALSTAMNLSWATRALDVAMSSTSHAAGVDTDDFVGFHCRVDEALGSEIQLDDYRKAVRILPGAAQVKSLDSHARRSVERWLKGPDQTGSDFSGAWCTSYDYEGGTTTDELHLIQEGNLVEGHGIETTNNWNYRIKGEVHGEVLIGEWFGSRPELKGNFLIKRELEIDRASGRWLGTGDLQFQSGKWTWRRSK